MIKYLLFTYFFVLIFQNPLQSENLQICKKVLGDELGASYDFYLVRDPEATGLVYG